MAPQFGVRATGKIAWSNAGNAVSTDAAADDEGEAVSDRADADEDEESADDASDDADDDEATDASTDEAEEAGTGSGAAITGSSTGAAARRVGAFEDEEEDDATGISS